MVAWAVPDWLPFVVGMLASGFFVERGRSPLVILVVIGWGFVAFGVVLCCSALFVAPDDRLGFLALGILVAMVGLAFLLCARFLARRHPELRPLRAVEHGRHEGGSRRSLRRGPAPLHARYEVKHGKHEGGSRRSLRRGPAPQLARR